MLLLADTRREPGRGMDRGGGGRAAVNRVAGSGVSWVVLRDQVVARSG